EELAVEIVLAGRRVARERDAGARVLAEVSVDHRADVDRRPHVARDAVQAAIDDSALVVPRAEDGADRGPQLLARILGERVASPLQDLRLEGGDQLLQVLDGELVVRLDAARVLLRLEQELEGVALGARG